MSIFSRKEKKENNEEEILKKKNEFVTLKEIADSFVVGKNNTFFYTLLEKYEELNSPTLRSCYDLLQTAYMSIMNSYRMRGNRFHNHVYVGQVGAYCIRKYFMLNEKEREKVRLVPLLTAALIFDYAHGSAKVKSCKEGKEEGCLRSFIYDNNLNNKNRDINYHLINDEVIELIKFTNHEYRQELRSDASYYSKRLAKSNYLLSAKILSDASVAPFAYLGIEMLDESMTCLEGEQRDIFRNKDIKNIVENIAGPPLSGFDDIEVAENYIKAVRYIAKYGRRM